MKLRQASLKDDEQRIAYYRSKPIEELRLIYPRWAFGENEEKIMDRAIRPSEGEYQILLLNTMALIKNSILFEVSLDTLFTGESKNDWRIATILYRWENNLYVDPPTVGICNLDKNKLAFSDGRHRGKLSAFLNLPQIPVAIHNDDVKDVLSKTSAGGYFSDKVSRKK